MGIRNTKEPNNFELAAAVSADYLDVTIPAKNKVKANHRTYLPGKKPENMELFTWTHYSNWFIASAQSVGERLEPPNCARSWKPPEASQIATLYQFMLRSGAVAGRKFEGVLGPLMFPNSPLGSMPEYHTWASPPEGISAKESYIVLASGRTMGTLSLLETPNLTEARAKFAEHVEAFRKACAASGQDLREKSGDDGGSSFTVDYLTLSSEATLAAEEPDYRLEAAQTFDLRVPPLGRQLIDLQLRYRAPAGRSIVLVSDPDNDSALVSASFVGEKIRIPTCADHLQNRPSRIRPNSLAHAVLSYAAVADEGFRPLVDRRKIHRFIDESPSLPIPGSISQHLFRTPWGTEIAADLYVGDSKKRGRQIFDAAVAEIRSACGASTGELVVEEDGELPHFATYRVRTIAPEAGLRLTFRDNFAEGDVGRYRVDLGIEALTPEAN